MRIHFGGSSRQSLVAARAKLDAAVKGATAASATELSSQLFFAADVLSAILRFAAPLPILHAMQPQRRTR